MSFSPGLRCFAITLLFAGSCLAQTAVKLPDTLPGKLMSEWLAMCNAPNLEQLTKWDADHFSEEVFKFVPAEKIAGDDVKDCNESGGYRAVEVIDSKPDRLRVLVISNKTDTWFNFNLVLDKDKGEKIGGFGAAPAIPPESTLPKGLSDAAISSAIDSYADRME